MDRPPPPPEALPPPPPAVVPPPRLMFGSHAILVESNKFDTEPRRLSPRTAARPVLIMDDVVVGCCTCAVAVWWGLGSPSNGTKHNALTKRRSSCMSICRCLPLLIVVPPPPWSDRTPPPPPPPCISPWLGLLVRPSDCNGGITEAIVKGSPPAIVERGGGCSSKLEFETLARDEKLALSCCPLFPPPDFPAPTRSPARRPMALRPPLLAGGSIAGNVTFDVELPPPPPPACVPTLPTLDCEDWRWGGCCCGAGGTTTPPAPLSCCCWGRCRLGWAVVTGAVAGLDVADAS